MDISLSMLELAINSLDAGATLVKIRLWAGRSVRLEVKDNGKGMDAYVLKRAREKGFSTKGSGGLGIYKTARFAKESGGRLILRSKEGKGTSAILKVKSAEIGDIASSLAAIVGDEWNIDFAARIGKRRIILDTRRVKKELGRASVEDARTLAMIKKYVNENLK